jgi:hypothetical protein
MICTPPEAKYSAIPRLRIGSACHSVAAARPQSSGVTAIVSPYLYYQGHVAATCSEQVSAQRDR